MKQLKNIILEKLVITKDTKEKQNNLYFALFAIYDGFDYLAYKFRNSIIVGDKGSGPSIFIVDHKTLLTLDKEYFEDKYIFVFVIPEKYQYDIDKFKKDYYDGKIYLDDDCDELDENETNALLNNKV